MKRAIFFDIDGTILAVGGGTRNITARVEKALRKLQAAGDYIFIATGRPYGFMYPELLNFGFDGFILTNGAHVLIGGKLIFHSELDKAAIRKICSYAESERVEYMLFGYPEIYVRRDFKTCDDFFVKLGIDAGNFVRDFDLDKISAAKIECVTSRRDVENLDVVYRKILSTEGFTGWADPFHYKSLEVYDKNISKATGISHVLKYLGVDVKDSYAFGDGFNDAEMLQAVGTSFAMDTAGDDLKRLAAHVVPSVFEDGVAVGIERFILGS